MDEIKNNFRNQEKQLVNNTVFLYILTFSSQFFNLLTIPFLTRVLGPSVYGKIGLATAYMSYVQIILDFGFILSATQRVVEKRNNPAELSKILTSVTVVKIGLSLFAQIILGLFFYTNSVFKGDFFFYMLYLFSYIINALMPDFFYRGIEKMKVITYRTILVKALFTILIFVFVHSAADYYKVPMFNLIGNLIAVMLMYIDMSKKYQVVLLKPDFSHMVQLIKHSAPFFMSRIASTTYQALNAIILGMIYVASPIVGYYTCADKIINLEKSVCSPIADSLYPYMIKERNFKLVKRMLIILTPIIFAGTVIVFIFADPICVLLFGSEYKDTGDVLRCLLPIAIVILPSYVLCFPVMVPMGLSKYANRSNLIGMCIQLAGLLCLYVLDYLNIYSICLLSSLSEVSVFVYRFCVVVIHNNLQKRERL